MAAPTATTSSGFTPLWRRLAEDRLDLFLHLGHAGHAAHQNDLVNLGRVKPRVL